MKLYSMFQRMPKMALAVVLLGSLNFISGCGSTSEDTREAPRSSATGAASKIKPLPPEVILKSEGNVQGYWAAEDFKLKNYDSVQIEPTAFAAIERDNEGEMRAMATRAIPEQIAAKFRETSLFANVYLPGEQPKAGGSLLRLSNTITEFSQGGNVGRIFGGVFGAGQPVVKVQGRFLDGDRVVFVYELRRSSESDEDKFLGGGKSNEEIQRNDIKVLANDLVQLLRGTAGS